MRRRLRERDHRGPTLRERRDRGPRRGARSISHCSCAPGNARERLVVDDLRRRQILGEDPIDQVRSTRAIARERARTHQLGRVQPRGRRELERRERPAPDREVQRAEVRALQRLRRRGELLDPPASREILEVQLADEPLRLGVRRTSSRARAGSAAPRTIQPHSV